MPKESAVGRRSDDDDDERLHEIRSAQTEVLARYYITSANMELTPTGRLADAAGDCACGQRVFVSLGALSGFSRARAPVQF